MSASSASTPGIDPRTIAWMTRNEADMSFRMRARTVFEWIPLQEDSLILDLPCGRGFYLNMLRHVSDCRLVGVDLDWSVLQQAQRTVTRLPRLQLSRADAMALPWAANTFDAIILTELLEHVADDVAVLRECLRVLQPGGVIAITVPHANYPFAWDPINKSLEKLFGTKIRRGPLAGIWANHLRLYTPAQLRARVLQAGFQIEGRTRLHASCLSLQPQSGLWPGQALLESGVLPEALTSVADRTRFTRADGSPLNPLRLAVRLLEWCDRHNVPAEPPGRATVNLAVKASKPL